MLFGVTHELIGLLARSSSSSNNGSFGAIFLLSGFVFYGFVFLKYRNVNKRHHYETETQAQRLNDEASDTLVNSLTDLSNSRMQGANSTALHGTGTGSGVQAALKHLPKSLKGIVDS